MKNMRSIGLLFTGIVIGVGISFAPDLYAASSKLLGGKVGNVLTVKIDDKTIGEGGVIGGTTYVPLRVVANNLGAEVVRVDKNEVVLSTGPDPTDTNMDQINAHREELITKIRLLNADIKQAEEVLENKASAERFIASEKEMLAYQQKLKDSNSPEFSEGKLLQAQQNIERTEKNISDAETNLPKWEKELADLEAQLAELQK